MPIHIRLVLPLTLFLGLACVLPAAAAQPQAPGHEGELLTGVRQLIFEGRRSGEGYFSADGTRMIFQSERTPGNPFYQMYVMDRDSGDVHRVSTGVGKTTCGWIHPDGTKVLFASGQAARGAGAAGGRHGPPLLLELRRALRHLRRRPPGTGAAQSHPHPGL